MSKPTKINNAAIRAIRLSEPVQRFTQAQAEKVAKAAGPGFVVKRSRGVNRARFVVVPTTPEAYKDNYESLAVVRALGQI